MCQSSVEPQLECEQVKKAWLLFHARKIVYSTFFICLPGAPAGFYKSRKGATKVNPVLCNLAANKGETWIDGRRQSIDDGVMVISKMNAAMSVGVTKYMISIKKSDLLLFRND
jgi:hypothetical protein